jgi:hypothetical protein
MKKQTFKWKLPRFGKAKETKKEPPVRRIICAAIKLKSGKVLCAPTYTCKIMQSSIFDNCKNGQKPASIVQQYGFIDQHGKFYSKRAAADLCRKNGLVKLPADQIKLTSHYLYKV